MTSARTKAAADVTSCRSCGAPLRLVMADLGESPLSNALVGADAPPDQAYPLTVYVCESCWLAQLEAFEAPEAIFREYAYFSSFSDSWLAHVRRFADGMRERLSLDRSSFVVEVASNDGHLLRPFIDNGIRALGIEPARNVAAHARAAGVPTVDAFLGASSGAAIAAEHGRADLLVANNVLAHVPDLNDFVAGLREVLAPHGLLAVEFPHLMRLIERCEFDTIYHEHFSYFSLLAARRIFETHGLRVDDVEELPTHGGSLRLHIRHARDGSTQAGGAVDRLSAAEVEAGMNGPAVYRMFKERVELARERIRTFLGSAKASGQRVAGYGAPAKATTLLNYCDVGTDLIEYTVDRNPYKQGRFIPGVRVPIYAPEAIFERKPDVVVILPWNIGQEIVKQMSGVRSWGGQFAVLIPEPHTVP